MTTPQYILLVPDRGTTPKPNQLIVTRKVKFGFTPGQTAKQSKLVHGTVDQPQSKHFGFTR